MRVLNLLESIEEACEGLCPDARVYIAYSGGVDSQVLLHAAIRWGQQQGVDATALHLNHGLSPNANDWQAFCKAQCEALGVPLLSRQVDIGGASSSGLEQRAREARYTWFESLLEAGDVLLMAHHREDQAETFMLRAMRGSGVRGLAAIPAKRVLGNGQLMRPFLTHSKADILAYAKQHALRWIEDESNLSLKFDRNYIRHQVMPVLAKRWPLASRQLQRSVQNCRDDQHLLAELAELDLGSCQRQGTPLLLEMMPPLDLTRFRAMSFSRQRNLLHYLLRPLLAYPVAIEKMNEWLRQVNDATPEAQSQLNLDSLSLILHNEQVHFCRLPELALAQVPLEWCTSLPLSIEQYVYELRLVLLTEKPAGETKTLAFKAGDTVSVHWRQGGERVQLPGEDFSRALKKLFQEKRVAPWLRRVMPLISIDGVIVWSPLLGDFSPRLLDAQGRYYSFDLQAVS